MQQMKSKRDLAIDQVPITTKPPLTELLHINEVTRSDFKNKEESPYKPQTTLLCVRSRLKNAISLIFSPKKVTTFAMNY
jgi:hypothetical protein